MSDLDEELLALAGSGEESGEEVEDTQVPPSRSLSRSLSRTRSRSRLHSRSRSPRRDSPSSPVLAPATKMSRGKVERRKADDSEEEGEASDAPGSPGSLGSGAMEESDTEGSDDEGGFGKGGRPGETAFEREKRLAEQAEREQERLKTAKLKALINERDRDRTDPGRAKRKADSVELDEDDFDDRPSRRTKKETTSRRINRRKLSETPEVDDEDEVKTKKDDGRQPGTLQEYERVRMGRSRFAQVCFFPSFAETFEGSFTRVCSGQDPMTGQNVYRMAEIKGFKTGKPYKIVSKDDRAFMTDRWVVAAYGPIEKEYPMTACSDSNFTEDEFQRRNQMLESSSIKQNYSSQLQAKCSDINEFLARSWTSQQITEKVNNQHRLAHLMTGPANPVVGPKTLQRDEALYKRNQENRRLNAEQVRGALLADRKKRRMAAEEAARKQREELERQKKAAVDGLFDDADEAGNGTAAQEPKAKPVSKYVHRDYKKGVNDFSRHKTDDEIIASMDLDIEIDI